VIMQTTTIAIATTPAPACPEEAVPPEDSALAGVLGSADPAIALLGLMINGRGVQNDVARTDVERQSKVIEELRARIAEELRKADEAQHHAGLFSKLSQVFSGDIGALLGVVAAAAATIATGGASAVAVVALVGATATATADVGARLGLDPTLCKLLSAAGALLSVAGGNVGAASGACATVSAVTTGFQGAAAVAGAGTHVAAKLYEADAADSQAEAKRGEGLQDQASARIDTAIEILRNAARDLARATDTVSSIEANQAQGRAEIIVRLGAA